MSNIYQLSSDEEYKKILVANRTSLFVVNFWADWAEPCKQMNEVFTELATRQPSAVFISVEAEKFPSISEAFDISAVPAFKIFHNGRVLATVSGPNAPELTIQVEAAVDKVRNIKKNAASNKPLSNSNASPKPPPPVVAKNVMTPQQLEARLKSLITKADVMLFMKGDPSAPQCGFSRQIVALLQEQQIKFDSFDILTDDQVRQGLKKLSDWPTYPQLYVKGELVGGLDIVREMLETGEFQEVLSS